MCWRDSNMAEARFAITPLANHFRIILRCGVHLPGEEKVVSSYPYACAIGSIMCAMVCSRFDLAYAGIRKSVHVKSGEAMLGAVKWIFRCLRGTVMLGSSSLGHFRAMQM